MADASGTKLLDKQRMETNSWVDSLTRIGGRGGIRDVWPIWSFAERKVKHGEWDNNTVLRESCCHWPCSTSVCTSSSEQESGMQMPSKYSTVPCRGTNPRWAAGLHFAVFLLFLPALVTLCSTVLRRWVRAQSHTAAGNRVGSHYPL